MSYNYHETLDQLAVAAETLLKSGAGVIFVTQARSKLNQFYLSTVAMKAKEHGLDEESVKEMVQHYTCSTCSKFMARVGHLVVQDGEETRSVYWDPSVVEDPILRDVVSAMKSYVEDARILNIFNPAGPYSNYEEFTNLGGKGFRHYYIKKELLTHRKVDGSPIDLPDVKKQFDQFSALIRFTKEVGLKAAMATDSLFEGKYISHVSSSKKNLKAFLELQAHLAAIKASGNYQTTLGEYNQETLLINAIWMFAVKNPNILSIRNSILGQLLRMVEEGGSSNPDKLKAAQEFWKVNTDGLHYMRTTREASESQLAQTAQFLEEGGWNESLKQIEAAEADIPVHWVAAKRWTFENIQEETQQGFENFVTRKTKGEQPRDSIPLSMDAGYFFNEVLPYVESMGLVLTNSRFSPVLINRMASMDAKPIFRWDTEETRAPFIPWRYNDPFYVSDLVTDKTIVKDGKIVVPVLSVSSNRAINYGGREEGNPILFFQLGGIGVEWNPKPTLFAEALKPEFHHHRRGLEDYSRETSIPRCKGQQSISLLIGPKNPHVHQHLDLLIEVTYNKDGAIRFSEKSGIYRVNGAGYNVVPNLSRYLVITGREGGYDYCEKASDVAQLEDQSPSRPETSSL